MAAHSERAPSPFEARASRLRRAIARTSGRRLTLPPRRIALHATRIGGRLAALAVARGGGEPPFGPVRTDLDLVAALLQLILRRLRHAAFEHHDAGTRGARPERGEKVLGVPGWRIDRLLQVHLRVNVAQEELRDPLVLLIAARRAPGEVRLAVAQREGGRQRRARTLAGRERGGMALLEPEHLRARAEREAELRNDRRGMQPAAGRRGRHHVA